MPFFVCVSEEIINSEKRLLDDEDNKQMMILFLFGLIFSLFFFFCELGNGNTFHFIKKGRGWESIFLRHVGKQ
jgi:hypothetical protein